MLKDNVVSGASVGYACMRPSFNRSSVRTNQNARIMLYII